MAVCPYCKKEINADNLITEELSKKAFKFGKEMFSCPHCKSILGFASTG
jgi:uncharacterized protein with PIN domain